MIQSQTQSVLGWNMKSINYHNTDSMFFGYIGNGKTTATAGMNGCIIVLTKNSQNTTTAKRPTAKLASVDWKMCLTRFGLNQFYNPINMKVCLKLCVT